MHLTDIKKYSYTGALSYDLEGYSPDTTAGKYRHCYLIETSYTLTSTCTTISQDRHVNKIFRHRSLRDSVQQSKFNSVPVHM